MSAARCPACGGEATRPGWPGRGQFGAFRYVFRECTGCRSIFIDPMPGPAEFKEMYGLAYQSAHYEGDGAFRELDAELEEAVAVAARHAPSGRLLDVGCGSGRFMQAAARDGLSVEGHELVDATARATAAKTGLVVHSGPLGRVTGSFDVVHLADVLEHLPSPLETLREVRRLLRPGGVAILRGPLEAQAHLFLWAVRAQRRVKDALRESVVTMPPWHVIQFSLSGWQRLLQRGGLRTVRESVSEIRWPVDARASGSMVRAMKSVSRRLSHSTLAGMASLGNRVFSVVMANR